MPPRRPNDGCFFPALIGSILAAVALLGALAIGLAPLGARFPFPF